MKGAEDYGRLVVQFLPTHGCTGRLVVEPPSVSVHVTSGRDPLGYLTVHADGDVTDEGMSERGGELSEGARRQIRWARLLL